MQMVKEIRMLEDKIEQEMMKQKQLEAMEKRIYNMKLALESGTFEEAENINVWKTPNLDRKNSESIEDLRDSAGEDK